MKKFLSIFLLFIVLGCTKEWNFYVIDDNVKEYSLSELKSLETDVIYETVVEKEIRKVEWKGVPSDTLGEGDIINYISEDLYLVSVPYNVDTILAYKKEGKNIPKEEGGPLKIAVDPSYGCKCNWLKYLKIVEFVDSKNSLSVHGEVTNILYFSPRDLNIFYSIEDIIENRYNRANLNKILDKAICKSRAENITFIAESDRKTFDLYEIKDMNPEIVYENGFNVPSLNLKNIKAIKIE